MRAQSLTLPSFLLRCLLVSLLSVSGVTASGAEQAAPPKSGSISNYRWNLNNESMPLISLPDHIGGGFDLSLAYPMDQFEFPLFQSLYYNARAGKYILMVIPKDDLRTNSIGVLDRRAGFVDLYPVAGGGRFKANGRLSFQLTDRGNVKVFSASDGTAYSFATFADGQLHCSQISDRYGRVIRLNYTNDALLKTIADDRGRTVAFGYSSDYVSSITQTWNVNSKRLRQTWAIADEVRFAHRPAPYVPSARLAMSKHIPSNAIKPSYTREMAASDSALANIFGGPGAIAAANGFEPAGLGSQYPIYRGDLIADDGRILRGHLSYAMHLYGSAEGTAETELYIPAGFISHGNEPSPTDAAVTFYYPRLGNLRDVTLAVFHIRNFQLSYEGERVRIGNIGGPGGSIGSYKHSHFEFYRGNTGLPSQSARVQLRIDPATVFGSMRATAH